jgi:hypothetical protein
MFYSKELDQVMFENFSRAELNKFAVAMESPNVSTDVMKQAFDTVVGGMTSYIRELISPRKLDKDIEASHGDITKVKGIEITLKLLKLLKKDKSKDVSKFAGLIESHYNYIKSHKVEYARGYHEQGKLSGMFVWCTYIVGVEQVIAATSHLTMYQSGRVKKMSSLLIDTESMVELYKKGSMDKYLKFFLEKKSDGVVKEEAAIVITALLLGAIISVAFFLRVLVFYFYFVRMELSDYFVQQNDFINLHAAEIKKDSSLSAREKDEIIKNQKVWAERFMDLSELIADKDLVARRQAQNTIVRSNKEVNQSTVSVPNVGMDFL